MTRDLSSLLRIDFEAALAKLAWAQLQGAWEIPAELVRLAIAHEAVAVNVEVTASRLVLVARGAQLERSTVSNFASMLDRELESEERHRAMVELEEAEAFVLSAVACSQVDSVILRTGGAGGMRLEMRAGAELSVINPGAETVDRSGLELEVRGLPIDAEKAVRWLARVGRFAAVPVSVNGRRVDLAFKNPLISARLTAASRRAKTGSSSSAPELSVQLAIPPRGSSPRLWLLRHGIIATRATVPGHPPFEAAIEMAPVAPVGKGATASTHGVGIPSPAALRERLGPYLPSILDAATRLAIRLGQDASSLTEPVRARIARWLLEAVRKRLRVAEASGVQVFALVGPTGRELVSIDEIARRVRVESGGVCSLEAISLDQEPRRFVLPERGVLVLSDSERTLLAEHLCVVFDTPPARFRSDSGRGLFGRLADRVSSWRRQSGEQIAESDLDEVERQFLSRVRVAVASAAEGEPPAVAFHTGNGEVFMEPGGLVLPRANDDVRRSVRIAAQDPEWSYPAILSLLGDPSLEGLDLARSDIRREWLGD